MCSSLSSLHTVLSLRRSPSLYMCSHFSAVFDRLSSTCCSASFGVGFNQIFYPFTENKACLYQNTPPALILPVIFSYFHTLFIKQKPPSHPLIGVCWCSVSHTCDEGQVSEWFSLSKPESRLNTQQINVLQNVDAKIISKSWFK